jgi:xylulokinase
MARAVFEGVTCGLAECAGLLEAMGSAASEVRVNGGGAQSLFWTQMLADMLQTPCTTLEVDEGPAFGAALLAGVGVGVYPSVVEACQSVIRRAREIVPLNQDYSGVAKRYKDLYLATRAWNTNISS